MMLWIPKLCLLLAISIYWGNQSFPYLPLSLRSANGGSGCDRISDKGFIHVRTSDLSDIEEICTCAGLRQISFKKCEINALPDCISGIAKLESLDISKTHIERFPEEILSLKELKNLDLSFTPMCFLPPNLSKLMNLETLNLRGTEISVLPEGLDHLKKIDMRMIEMSRKEQEDLRAQYPKVKIYFSSPCNCK